MIELRNVTKLYGSVIGVNDVDLTLAPGAYGLLGPNGSGKTTLLNLLTGQLFPSLGQVQVMGDRPNAPEILARIGFCPGFEGMYANVSAFEWVTYLLELHGYSRSEAKARAGDSLNAVGLAEAMHRPIGGYSRGMRQRAKFAQATAHDPELLILDEPFNGLDPIGRHDITTMLRDWMRRGKSLILSSHILHEVEAITTSFLLIYGGRLLASGSAEEVYSLLTDVPSDIVIRCANASLFAQQLLREELVEGVVSTADGGMRLATRHALRVYQRLPVLSQELGITLEEVHSSDDSLQAVFGTLLRLRRGDRFSHAASSSPADVATAGVKSAGIKSAGGTSAREGTR